MKEYKIAEECPRCKNRNLDSGRLGVGASGVIASLGYLSDKQQLFSQPASISAKVCLDCGYIVELYGNVEDLKRRLKK